MTITDSIITSVYNTVSSKYFIAFSVFFTVAFLLQYSFDIAVNKFYEQRCMSKLYSEVQQRISQAEQEQEYCDA